MRSYYRVMLGRNSIYAPQYFQENCIAIGYIFGVDLSSKLHEQWREFNKEFIPVFLKENPDKSKIGAGLACGTQTLKKSPPNYLLFTPAFER